MPVGLFQGIDVAALNKNMSFVVQMNQRGLTVKTLKQSSDVKSRVCILWTTSLVDFKGQKLHNIYIIPLTNFANTRSAPMFHVLFFP